MILKTKIEIIDAKLLELSEAIAKEIERCKAEMIQRFIDEHEEELAEAKPARKKSR